MYLDQAKTLFATLHIAAHEISQCTETEVAQLEQQSGHAIPAAYCKFLLWMGHGAGNFLRGSDVFYEHLRSNVSAARELLRENNISLDLPVDALVFYTHQGYQFAYFQLSAGDNPPVYYYGEGEGVEEIRELYPCFSDFLEREIEGHAELLREAAERQAKKRLP